MESAYCNSVSAATGLAPNEVHLGRLPRLLLTVFDLPNVGGHEGLDRDHLAYMDFATARQQRAFLAVREQHKIVIWRLDRRNAPILAPLGQSRPFLSVVGRGLRLRFHHPPRCQEGTGAIVLKTKQSLDSIGPQRILAVGPAPASDIPDGQPLHDKLINLNLQSDMPGRDSNRRVSVARCMPCQSPNDIHDLPKHLPANLTKYVLNSFRTKSFTAATSPSTTSQRGRKTPQGRTNHGPSAFPRPWWRCCGFSATLNGNDASSLLMRATR